MLGRENAVEFYPTSAVECLFCLTKRTLHMKRLLAAICIVTCLALTARSDNYFDVQGDVMECSPPKFMLIADVDLKAQTLTGLSTIEIKTPEAPKPVVGAFHRTLKLTDIKVTNARRKAIGEIDLQTLKGKLVVISEGKTPLSAAFLGLFREDTLVITIASE
jgi:hypothetical protein